MKSKILPLVFGVTLVIISSSPVLAAPTLAAPASNVSEAYPVDSITQDVLSDSTGDHRVGVTVSSFQGGSTADWIWTATAIETAPIFTIDGVLVTTGGGADLSKANNKNVSFIKNGESLNILTATPKYLNGYGDIVEVRLAKPVEYKANDKIEVTAKGLKNATKPLAYNAGLQYIVAGQPTAYPRYLPVGIIVGVTEGSVPTVNSVATDNPASVISTKNSFPVRVIVTPILLILALAYIIWRRHRD